MLANIPLPDPGAAQSVGWIVLTLAGVAVALLAILKLIDRFKDKPAPADVQRETAERFVLKSDCAARHAADAEQARHALAKVNDELGHGDRSRKGIYKDLEDLRKNGAEQVATIRREMGEMERRLNAADEARTAELHQKFNDVAKGQAAVEKAVEIQGQQQASISAKLDRLIERTAGKTKGE